MTAGRDGRNKSQLWSFAGNLNALMHSSTFLSTSTLIRQANLNWWWMICWNGVVIHYLMTLLLYPPYPCSIKQPHCNEVHWTLPAIFPLSPDHSSTCKSTLHTSSVFTYSTTLSPPSSFKVRLLHKSHFFGNTKSQTKNMPEFVLIFSWSANTKLMKVFLKNMLSQWLRETKYFLTPYHPLI